MLKTGLALGGLTAGLPTLLTGLTLLSGSGGGIVPSAYARTDIPAAYLARYQQAAATCPGLPWAVLAAIGKIESDHGRLTAPGVRAGHNSKGAMGPMQFEPATWQAYGIDGDHDGTKNVYDPADAIPAAANLLCADGAKTGTTQGLRRAIFAYNHADWYVHDVLKAAANYVAYVPSTAASGTAATAIAYARAQLGKPYLWGGTGPNSFDCSGLTMRAWQAAGITIPRTAELQWNLPHIPAGQEQPGDLAFYHLGPAGPGHVALVIDPTRHLGIEAPHHNDVVKYFNYQNGAIGYARVPTPTR